MSFLQRLQAIDAECAQLDNQLNAIQCRRAELQKEHIGLMEEARAVADPDDALHAYLKRQKIYEDTHDVIYKISVADGNELMWRKCDDGAYTDHELEMERARRICEALNTVQRNFPHGNV
jgi:hypothetical protein